MPNGVYPVPKFRFPPDRVAATRRPTVFLRARVALHADRLVEDLARGADPTASAALGLRAQQLLRGRARLADRVERVLDHARTRSVAFTAAAPVRRAEVRDCAEDLLALAARLRDGRAVDVQGVAMTAQLLRDGASPLYTPGVQSLRHSVRAARLALDPIGAATSELAAAA